MQLKKRYLCPYERWKGGIDKEKMTAEIKENAQIGRDKLEKEIND